MKRATNTCDFKSRHNLLQDLLFSKIVLERCTLVNRRPFGPDYAATTTTIPFQDIQARGDLSEANPSQVGQSCSICSSDNQIDWISEEEMEILLKVVFNSSPINFDLVLTSRCKLCASTLATLTKLKKRIEDTVLCLRAVFKVRNDPQFAEISTVNVENKNTSEIIDEIHYIMTSPDEEDELKPKIEDMELEIADLEDRDDDKLVEVYYEAEILNPEVTNEDGSTDTTTKISRSGIKSISDGNCIAELNTNETNTEDSNTNVSTRRPTCRICGISFASDYSFKRHTKRIHKMVKKRLKKGPQPSQPPIMEEEEMKPIIVGMELEISDVENNDEAESLPVKPRDNSTFSSKIECQLCRSSFSSSSKLKHHLRVKGEARCKGKRERKENRANNSEEAETGQESDNCEHADRDQDQVSDRATVNHNVKVKRKSRVRAEKLLRSISDDTEKIGQKQSLLEIENTHASDDSDYSNESCNEEMEDNSLQKRDKSAKGRTYEYKNTEEIPTQEHINVCEQCGKCFNWKCYLVRHLIKQGWHKGQYKPKPECLKGPKKCEICLLDFVCGFAYETHLESKMHGIGLKRRQVSAEGVISFRCPFCEESFKTLEELIHHEKHRKCVKHICEPCNKRFTTTTAYRSHLRGNRHMQNVLECDGIDLEKDCKFRCDICSKGFLHKNNLLQHNEYHHDKQFICELCGKAYGTSAGLKFHHNSHANEGKPRPRKKPRKRDQFVEPRNKPYGCLKCKKRFQIRKSLNLHTKVVHQGFRFKCDNCLTEFKSALSLARHQIKFHNPLDKTVVVKKIARKGVRYPCEFCSYSATQKAKTLRHIELKHFPDKTSCPYGCPDEISNEDEWLQHLKSCKSPKLSENSLCKCPDCGEIFRNQLLKMDHHLKQHNCYSCEFCKKKLILKMSWELHLLEHEESKPFLCTKCGKRFRQKYNLDLHSTTVCGDDEKARKELLAKRREQHRVFRDKDKPHKCDQCSKAFILEDKLKAHMKNVHGNAERAELDNDV